MIANALGPVFLLIVCGALLRRLDVPGLQYWPGIERLTYYVAFPALLVHRLALADFSGTAIVQLVTIIVAALLLVSLILCLFRNQLAANHADFTSIFQGGIRFNTYIGLAVASALYGDEGMVSAAIALAILVPLVNLLSVLSFAVGNPAQSLSARSVVLNLIGNPLIVACLLGVALNISGIGLPGWSAELLAQLGAAALPLGLMAVGVGLQLRSANSHFGAILGSILFKFMLFPASVLLLSLIVPVQAMDAQVLLLIACLPTASSAYILARQLGGNAEMMASIVSAQSLLAFLVIPVWIWFGSNLLA